jgi:hypothetical protein
MNKIKLLSIIFATLTLGIVAFLLSKQFIKEPSFDKVLNQAAKSINKNCPVMLDKHTKLKKAVALPNKVFQYNHQLISLEKNSIELNSFDSIMKNNLLKYVVSTPDMSVFRENHVTLLYNYVDKHNKFISKILIKPSDYIKN